MRHKLQQCFLFGVLTLNFNRNFDQWRAAELARLQQEKDKFAHLITAYETNIGTQNRR